METLALAPIPEPDTARLAPPPRPSRTRSIMVGVRAGIVALVAFMLLGNLLILVMHAAARSSTSAVPAGIHGVEKLQQVDGKVWRGAAPSRTGYIELAAAGVRTIVDLRAEENLHVDQLLLDRLGLDRIHMPIRDGQIPSADQVARFRAIVERSKGLVFVHCGAGVGRTGSMSAAYLVATGQANGWGALRKNLAVGPPSLEQVAFVAGLDGDAYQRPRTLVVAASRVLDAPRRLWSSYGL